MSGDCQWINFENDAVKYTAQRWDIECLSKFIGEKVDHIERAFRRGASWYEELQEQLRDVFNMDDLSDDESQGEARNYQLWKEEKGVEFVGKNETTFLVQEKVLNKDEIGIEVEMVFFHS